MGLSMLTVSGLVVAGVVWLARGQRDPKPADLFRARQILDERFARGEIDVAEYATRPDHLAAR